MNSEGDYRVIIKVKNARLFRAMERRGISTQSELAKVSGVSPTDVGQLANLTRSGMNKKGDWYRAVVAISAALRCMPEDIVPDAHKYQALTHNMASFDTDIEEIKQLITTPTIDMDRQIDLTKIIGTALETLRPRDRLAIEMKFGLNGHSESSYAAIAKELGVERERARQICARGMRHLQHPKHRNLRYIAGTRECPDLLEELVVPSAYPEHFTPVLEPTKLQKLRSNVSKFDLALYRPGSDMFVSVAVVEDGWKLIYVSRWVSKKVNTVYKQVRIQVDDKELKMLADGSDPHLTRAIEEMYQALLNGTPLEKVKNEFHLEEPEDGHTDNT